MFEIMKLLANNGALKSVSVSNPVTFAGRAMLKLGDYLPNDSELSILKSNLPLLVGIAEKAPAFQQAFDAWLADIEQLRTANNV
jgi:hypothetical protein